MSMIIIDGKPGMGKTLLLTYLAYKNFKEKNPPLKVFFNEKIKRKKWVYDISEYSDFPICFKKANKGSYLLVYDDKGIPVRVPYINALQWRIFDLILDNKFRKGANFYLDEIQQKYDSMDYKVFPDSIAHYCQFHRHFDNNIYTDSQSQSRIVKRVLCLGEEYWSIKSFRKIFGFVIMHIRVSFDMHNNLESNNGNNNVDFEERRIIFRLKKVGTMYDSKYGRHLQDNSKLYPSRMYDSLDLTKEQLLDSFFPSEEEKKRIENMRY